MFALRMASVVSKPSKPPVVTKPAASSKTISPATSPATSQPSSPPAKKPGRVRPAPEPLTLTEKVFIGVRVEKVFPVALAGIVNRSTWDDSVSRSGYSPPRKKGETVITKPIEGAVLDYMLPFTLGGVFQMRIAIVRQPQGRQMQGYGFAIEAIRGGLGPVAGIAESWQLVPMRGGTELTITRMVVPRFKWLKNYVEGGHRKALRGAIEAFVKHYNNQ
jgi:hypothetical protein